MVFNMPALIKFIVKLFQYLAALFAKIGIKTPEMSQNEIVSKVGDALEGWLDGVE